jgi:hypothetical protein
MNANPKICIYKVKKKNISFQSPKSNYNYITQLLETIINSSLLFGIVVNIVYN